MKAGDKYKIAQKKLSDKIHLEGLEPPANGLEKRLSACFIRWSQVRTQKLSWLLRVDLGEVRKPVQESIYCKLNLFDRQTIPKNV